MTEDKPELPVFLTPAEVSDMLKTPERTLENWRLAGTGPRYYKIGGNGRGKILYKVKDLLEWIESRRR